MMLLWVWMVPTTNGFVLRQPQTQSSLRLSFKKNVEEPEQLKRSYRSEIDEVYRPSRLSVSQRWVRTVLKNPNYEIASSCVTLFACGLFALRTMPHLDPAQKTALYETEVAISVVFAVEWSIRWLASGQLRYPLKPFAIVDLISFLPVFVDAWENQLSFLRLLRILRLQRLLSDAETFKRYKDALMGESTKVRKNRKWTSTRRRRYSTVTKTRRKDAQSAVTLNEETVLQLARVLSTLFTLLFVSSGLIYTFEHDVNEDIPDFFTALYFGLTTLTTVGFGDITPVTPNGRLVVSFSILAGIGIIPVQVTSLAEALLQQATTRKSQR